MGGVGRSFDGETHRVEGGEGFVLAIDQSPVARAKSRRGVSDASCLLKVPPKKRSRSTSGEGSASSREKRKEKTQNRRQPQPQQGMKEARRICKRSGRYAREKGRVRSGWCGWREGLFGARDREEPMRPSSSELSRVGSQVNKPDPQARPSVGDLCRA